MPFLPHFRMGLWGFNAPRPQNEPRPAPRAETATASRKRQREAEQGGTEPPRTPRWPWWRPRKVMKLSHQVFGCPEVPPSPRPQPYPEVLAGTAPFDPLTPSTWEVPLHYVAGPTPQAVDQPAPQTKEQSNNETTADEDTAVRDGDVKIKEEDDDGDIVMRDADNVGEDDESNEQQIPPAEFREPVTPARPTAASFAAQTDTSIKVNPEVSYSPQPNDHRARVRAAREAEIAEKIPDWPEGSVSLYRKLHLRGLQPTLPSKWKDHLITFPLGLFTEKEEKVDISALNNDGVGTGDYHYTRGIEKLCKLGARTRDNHICGVAPERPGYNEIKSYMKMVWRDAGISARSDADKLPTNLFVMRASADEPLHDIVARVTRKFEKMQAQWMRALRVDDPNESMVLYGLLCVGQSTAIMGWDCNGAYIPGGEDQRIRNFTICNWAQKGNDVWNALAVAQTVGHCRDDIIAVLEEGPLDLGLEVGGVFWDGAYAGAGRREHMDIGGGGDDGDVGSREDLGADGPDGSGGVVFHDRGR